MRVLAIDTALQSCGVALLDGETVVFCEAPRLEKGHAEVLPPLVSRALDAAAWRVGDLDRVGVVVGPGGFAGVRVGLAYARGLGLGTGVDVVGVGSLDALAATFAAVAGTYVACIVDARRGDVFSALYEGTAPLSPAFAATPEDAAARLGDAVEGAPLTLIGGGAALIPSRARQPSWSFKEGDLQIDPAALARLAAAAPAPDGPPAPVYLRAPDARPAAPSRFDGRV
ncbi:MAG: tRNA (adenosine(37)-N6)-threonylcarbamoyltransferase complex dimerization subunit type 1 TsaB [Parvularculaceae bacterium]